MLNKFNALLIFFLLLAGCSVTQKTLTRQESVLKKLSLEKFGTSSRLIYNSDKSYSIVVKQEKSTAKNPNPLLQFFVYDIGKDKIIFEESIPAGKIKWRNNRQFEVTITPEMISTEDSNKLYGYIYDVDLGTKTDLNSQSIKQN
ncbi:MAG: hypothetical protein ACYC4T_01260 [Melioribacteraceae bacterium]